MYKCLWMGLTLYVHLSHVHLVASMLLCLPITHHSSIIVNTHESKKQERLGYKASTCVGPSRPSISIWCCSDSDPCRSRPSDAKHNHSETESDTTVQNTKVLSVPILSKNFSGTLCGTDQYYCLYALPPAVWVVPVGPPIPTPMHA